MNPFMLLKLGACVESFEANVTFEGTLTIVPHLVLLFGLRSRKPHIAFIALIRSKTQMLIDMSV